MHSPARPAQIIITADVLAGHQGAPGLLCDLLGADDSGWCANRSLAAGTVAGQFRIMHGCDEPPWAASAPNACLHATSDCGLLTLCVLDMDGALLQCCSWRRSSHPSACPPPP